MIYGIGTDIVQIARIQSGLDRFGERFAERILTPRELEQFRTQAQAAAFVAKRFAAKEAAVKALGTGFRAGITLRSIEVTREEMGRPGLDFLGAAEDMRNRLGIIAAHLSLSDERDYALAFVTLIRQ